MTENYVKDSESVKTDEVQDTLNKLSLALSKLLEESLVISDDTILEKLFSHLVEKFRSDGCIKKKLEVYVLWLSSVMKQWNSLQSNIQVFAVRLTGLICSSSVGFFMLEERKVIAMFAEQVQQQLQCDSSLMLAMVNLITEAVKHQVGVNWAIQTEIWRSAVHMCHLDSSLYTSKASAKLITNLIILFESSDEYSCHLVIDAIVEPLCITKTKGLTDKINLFKSLQSCVGPYGVSVVSDDALPKEKYSGHTPANCTVCQKTPICRKVPNRILLATIKCVNEVLDALLMSRICTERVKNIFKYYNLEMWAWEQVHLECENVELLRGLSSMLSLLSFLGTDFSKQGEIYFQDLELLNITIFRLLETLIYKRQFTLVFDITLQCMRLKHFTIKTNIYKDDETKKNVCDLQNQLIILQSIPLFAFVRSAVENSGDAMDKFEDKLFCVAHNETKRISSQFQDMMRQSTNLNMTTLSQNAIISLIRNIDYVNKEQGTIILQTMFHLLRLFVPEEMYDSIVEKYPILLMHMLQCIIVINRKFDNAWCESLEILNLLTFCEKLISSPSITPRLCAQTLKLLQQLIENFNQLDEAFFLDNLKKPNIEKFGPLLLKKLHDESWEIRDSTLEVLQVIGKLSNSFLQEFLVLIFEPKLLDQVVNLAVDDLESYVRGSALLCLCDLVKVQNLWDNKLSSMSLHQIALNIVINETEGLVRKAACQLVTTIYKHQKISLNIKKEFHQTMFKAAVYDLYWEVKRSSLDFWAAVLDQELAYHGIIDKDFPSVNPLKRPHKILTHQEKRNCLMQILDKLSRIGCLQVLWMSLNDECDLEVLRATTPIINKLINILLLHSDNNDNKSSKVLVYSTFGIENNFTCNDENSNSEEEDEDMVKKRCKISQSEQILADNEANRTVDNDYTSLEPTVDKMNNKLDQADNIQIQQEHISPKDFLAKIMEIDINKMVRIRSNWLENVSENLESLLEDVLAINNDLPKHINNVGLDCY